MKKTLFSYLMMVIVLTLLPTGCSVDDPDNPTSLRTPEGDQVFKTYVAIGNSLTAGYMDSGLIQNGQINSFPLQIAQQMGIAGEDFTQPWVAFPGLGSTNVGDDFTSGVLHFDGASIVPAGMTPAGAEMGLLLAVAQPTPYHNLGVPGAYAADILNTINQASSVGDNPFFEFINRATLYDNIEKDATVFDLDGVTPKDITYQTASTGWQAIAKGPTLLTLWIGNNDILFGATGGNPSPANMTDPNEFAATYSDLMQVMAGGLVERTGFPATIIVANLPSITDTAFFLTEETFNDVLAANSEGAMLAWPWGYDEEDVQLLTFPVLSWIGDEANMGSPIPSYYTITSAEETLVATYVGAYNGAIQQIVDGINASGMAKVGLVDMNGILNDLPDVNKTHFMLLLPQMGGDVAMAAATSMFALDGVHPNNHGYGVVANAFIDEINAVVGTDLAHVDTAALTYDPTYGQSVDTKVAGMPTLSPEAAEQMTAIWR